MPIRDRFEMTLAGVWWTEGDRGAPGALTIQLLVDPEVAERALQSDPGDAATLLDYLSRGAGAESSPVPAGDGPGLLVSWVPALMMQT